MDFKNHRETFFVDDLHPEEALCSFEEAIDYSKITGLFGDYLYCVKNGRQVLLGHDNPGLSPSVVVTSEQVVFMSKADGQFHRRPTSWEELRASLEGGWVIGTDRYPGVKIQFFDNGKNYRKSPESIFVFNR